MILFTLCRYKNYILLDRDITRNISIILFIYELWQKFKPLYIRRILLYCERYCILFYQSSCSIERSIKWQCAILFFFLENFHLTAESGPRNTITIMIRFDYNSIAVVIKINIILNSVQFTSKWRSNRRSVITDWRTIIDSITNRL